MAPCFAGISLRSGAAIVGVLQLVGAAVSGIYFALLVSGYGNSALANMEFKIQTGVSAVLNLILGTILSIAVLTDRKDWCKYWVWISTLQAILSLVVTVLMVIWAFWIGFLWTIILVVHVWLIVVVYEFSNEKEEEDETEDEPTGKSTTDLCSTPQKMITEV